MKIVKIKTDGSLYRKGKKISDIPAPEEMFNNKQIKKFHNWGEINIKMTDKQLEYWKKRKN